MPPERHRVARRGRLEFFSKCFTRALSARRLLKLDARLKPALRNAVGRVGRVDEIVAALLLRRSLDDDDVLLCARAALEPDHARTAPLLGQNLERVLALLTRFEVGRLDLYLARLDAGVGPAPQLNLHRKLFEP